jgi:hypothetical protein
VKCEEYTFSALRRKMAAGVKCCCRISRLLDDSQQHFETPHGIRYNRSTSTRQRVNTPHFNHGNLLGGKGALQYELGTPGNGMNALVVHWVVKAFNAETTARQKKSRALLRGDSIVNCTHSG